MLEIWCGRSDVQRSSNHPQQKDKLQVKVPSTGNQGAYPPRICPDSNLIGEIWRGTGNLRQEKGVPSWGVSPLTISMPPQDNTWDLPALLMTFVLHEVHLDR